MLLRADASRTEPPLRLTLIQFDDVDSCEIVYDRTPIESVGKIDLVPRGGTPLLDAIGRSLAHFKKSLGEAKPDQVVVMIITDGQENSSHEFRRETVKQLIQEHEKEPYNWTFLYLGANVNSFAEAGGLGFSVRNVADYDQKEITTCWLPKSRSPTMGSHSGRCDQARLVGVLLGFIAATWRYIRTAWSQISSRLIVQVTVFDIASTAVMAYCRKNLHQSRFGPRSYMSYRVFVRPRSRYEGIVGEQLGHGMIVFWQGWKPLWVSRTSSSGSDWDESHVAYRPVQLTFIRGLFDPDQLIQDAEAPACSSTAWRTSPRSKAKTC